MNYDTFTNDIPDPIWWFEQQQDTVQLQVQSPKRMVASAELRKNGELSGVGIRAGTFLRDFQDLGFKWKLFDKWREFALLFEHNCQNCAAAAAVEQFLKLPPRWQLYVFPVVLKSLQSDLDDFLKNEWVPYTNPTSERVRKHLTQRVYEKTQLIAAVDAVLQINEFRSHPSQPEWRIALQSMMNWKV